MLQTFCVWGAFECAVAGIYWQDNLREILFGKFEFIFNHKFHYMTVQIEQSTFYLIRYCALSFVLTEVDDEDMTRAAVNVAHFHHERWDGRGYPEGLKEEQIPVEARIMALADVFDAVVSKRCYKEAFGFDRAFSIIEEGLKTQFDPVLGKLFLECRPELERLYIVMEEK